MQTRTALYSQCPSCHQNGLVQPVQATYRCAVCNFDYGTLAGDTAAREAWMLENLRLGGFFVLYVMALHRLILALPVEESNARVLEFARQNGVDLPKMGKLPNFKMILWVSIGVAILFGAFTAYMAMSGH
jgi:hypothetical protein